tara:strand:+ start:808 stop:948 length:141 start_codon:yes stop_codon:yes gene_type:complete
MAQDKITMQAVFKPALFLKKFQKEQLIFVVQLFCAVRTYFFKSLYT